jgi:cytochrome P450
MGTSIVGGRAEAPDGWAEDPHSFDLLKIDERFVTDPFPTYARLQDESPIHRNSDGTYFLTRYDDVAWILAERRVTSDKSLELTKVFGQSPLLEHYLHLVVFRDPPIHTRIRKVLASAFTPRAIELWAPIVSDVVDESLERALANGAMDLIGDFAYWLPINVISRMLGVPAADADLFRGWSQSIVKTLDPRITQEIKDEGNRVVSEFKEYMGDLAERKRREPGPDLMSLLVGAESEGDGLTELDLAHNAAFLLNAGHETTANLIGNAVDALFRFPDQLKRLRQEPELIETAVEEFLRFESPNQLGGRRLTEDVELRGVKIPAATYVWITNGGANRDPRQFKDPHALDIARKPNRHVAFGHGVHYCLGAALGRLEGGIALKRLVTDFPALRPNGAPKRRMIARYRGFSAYPIAV